MGGKGKGGEKESRENISIFGTLGWKMPIHASKICVFLANLIP